MLGGTKLRKSDMDEIMLDVTTNNMLSSNCCESKEIDQLSNLPRHLQNYRTGVTWNVL